MIIDIILKYFLNAVLVFMAAMISKYLVDRFGDDRAKKIKEAILTAMLWAEEYFGIGAGEQKWTAAWNKLIEILQEQNIKLKEGEISYVRDIMKATVPEINEKIYNAMPESIKEKRKIRIGNK